MGFDLEIWGPRKGKRGNSSLLWEPVGKDSDHGVGDKTFLKLTTFYYPRRSRSAIGVDTVFTLDVCMFVC